MIQCMVLRTKMSARYQKFRHWYGVQACLNTFSRQKVHVIAEMAIGYVQLFWFRAETQEINEE